MLTFLIYVIIAALIVGCLLWLFWKYAPAPPGFKNAVVAVVSVVFFIAVLLLFLGDGSVDLPRRWR